MNLRCLPLTPERLADYLDFFDHRAFPDNPRWAGCYCRFPLHDPSREVWDVKDAAGNREAVGGACRSGRAGGVLAYDGEQVVGWCNAGPFTQFPMLRDEPIPDAGRSGVIFCFVVAPDRRGQGIGRALLEGACAQLAAQGLAAVLARPLKHAEGPAANHLGPLSMYLAAGFEVLREEDDGAVLVRKTLG
jgi:ribosomal protein S18 acetylase RimI-like enzyme